MVGWNEDTTLIYGVVGIVGAPEQLAPVLTEVIKCMHDMVEDVTAYMDASQVLQMLRNQSIGDRERFIDDALTVITCLDAGTSIAEMEKLAQKAGVSFYHLDWNAPKASLKN